MIHEITLSIDEICEWIPDDSDQQLTRSILEMFEKYDLTYKINTDDERLRIYCYIKKSKETLIIYDCNYRADIMTLEELSDYRAVILTNSIVMDETRAGALRAYVEQGGTLVIDGRFGVVDPFSQLSEELPGGAMNDLCGEEFMDSDYENLSFQYGTCAVEGGFGRELMQLTDGEALATFADGYPAVVRRACGKGQVLFFNLQLWYGYHLKQSKSIVELTRSLLCELGVRVPEITGNVKLRVARTDGKVLFFLFNYGETEETVHVSVTVDGCLYELKATVAPNDSVIIRREA